jgi:hypothetical protein
MITRSVNQNPIFLKYRRYTLHDTLPTAESSVVISFFPCFTGASLFSLNLEDLRLLLIDPFCELKIIIINYNKH